MYKNTNIIKKLYPNYEILLDFIYFSCNLFEVHKVTFYFILFLKKKLLAFFAFIFHDLRTLHLFQVRHQVLVSEHHSFRHARGAARVRDEADVVAVYLRNVGLVVGH